jgi:hypothetical protein
MYQKVFSVDVVDNRYRRGIRNRRRGRRERNI